MRHENAQFGNSLRASSIMNLSGGYSPEHYCFLDVLRTSSIRASSSLARPYASCDANNVSVRIGGAPMGSLAASFWDIDKFANPWVTQEHERIETTSPRLRLRSESRRKVLLGLSLGRADHRFQNFHQAGFIAAPIIPRIPAMKTNIAGVAKLVMTRSIIPANAARIPPNRIGPV